MLELKENFVLNSYFPCTGHATQSSVQSGRQEWVGMQNVILPREGEVCLDLIRRQTVICHFYYKGQRISDGLWKCDDESRKQHSVQSILWEGNKTGDHDDYSLLWVHCMFSISLGFTISSTEMFLKCILYYV